jgi:hypothetical protein
MLNGARPSAATHLQVAASMTYCLRGVAVRTRCIWKSKVCNRVFTMGQGAGSKAGTGRFQAMGQMLDLTGTGPHHGRASYSSSRLSSIVSIHVGTSPRL